MAGNYNFSDLADMHLIYGEVGYNSRAAARLYQERFPNRRVPHRSVFSNVNRRLREFGNLRPINVDRGRPAAVNAVVRDEQILEMVAADPTLSVREIAHRIHVPATTVWTTISKERLHPYHINRVPALLPEDLPRRREFCEWLLQRNNEDLQFTFNLCFSDGANFSRNGVLNLRNLHYWSVDNPHVTRISNQQQRFSLNVWAGIFQNSLVGPFFIPNPLTGDAYLNFLQNELENFLDELPLQQRFSMWYMQDGAPPHAHRAVVEYLNNRFPQRWIGRRGPFPWPARSMDFRFLFLGSCEVNCLCYRCSGCE
jgi:transposase